MVNGRLVEDPAAVKDHFDQVEQLNFFFIDVEVWLDAIPVVNEAEHLLVRVFLDLIAFLPEHFKVLQACFQLHYFRILLVTPVVLGTAD